MLIVPVGPDTDNCVNLLIRQIYFSFSHFVVSVVCAHVQSMESPGTLGSKVLAISRNIPHFKSCCILFPISFSLFPVISPLSNLINVNKALLVYCGPIEHTLLSVLAALLWNMSKRARTREIMSICKSLLTFTTLMKLAPATQTLLIILMALS